MIESHKHSILKAISYRVFATIATGLLVLAVTGSAAMSAGIGISDMFLKLALYYAHERVWQKAKSGVNGRISRIKTKGRAE